MRREISALLVAAFGFAYSPSFAGEDVWLWRYPVLLEQSKAMSSGLANPDIAASLESRQVEARWNAVHPLLAVEAQDVPRYFSRVPRSMTQQYTAALTWFDLFSMQGPPSPVVLSQRVHQDITLENSMRMILAAHGADGLKVALATFVYVLPFMPGDPKRRVGAVMRQDDGSVERSAGKNWGNFQAGALGQWSGVSPQVVNVGADLVQMAQDASYIASQLIAGKAPQLDHDFGMDDPEGGRYRSLGASYARRSENAHLYRALERAKRSPVHEVRIGPIGGSKRHDQVKSQIRAKRIENGRVDRPDRDRTGANPNRVRYGDLISDQPWTMCVDRDGC